MVITGKKSGERLQDHWSSGFNLVAYLFNLIAKTLQQITNLTEDLFLKKSDPRGLSNPGAI